MTPLPTSIPIYGVHIHNLLLHIITIKDKKKRTQFAYILANHIKKIQNGRKHKFISSTKIWHDLHIMSDYQLDIDVPYTKPEKKAVSLPQPIGYNPQNKPSQLQYYGYNIANYITQLANIEDKDLQKKLLGCVVRLIIKFYKKRNAMHTILEYIQDLTGTKLEEHFAYIKTLRENTK